MLRTSIAALALVTVTACKKSAPEDAGSTPAAMDHMVDVMVDQMAEYTEQIMPIALAFDGDCLAEATRMLDLEPLAQQIRDTLETVESDPAQLALYKARMKAKQPEITAKLAAALKATGLSQAEADAKEKLLKAACANDPAFKRAVARVGLKKKQ